MKWLGVFVFACLLYAFAFLGWGKFRPTVCFCDGFRSEGLARHLRFSANDVTEEAVPKAEGAKRLKHRNGVSGLWGFQNQ